jgi:hypothetical protein
MNTNPVFDVENFFVTQFPQIHKTLTLIPIHHEVFQFCLLLKGRIESLIACCVRTLERMQTCLFLTQSAKTSNHTKNILESLLFHLYFVFHVCAHVCTHIVQLSTTNIKLSVDVIRLSLCSNIQEQQQYFRNFPVKKNKGRGGGGCSIL